MLNNKQVVVLLGGISAEKEVSLVSGNAVYNSLLAAKINVIKYEVTNNFSELYNFFVQNKNSIVVFNALHGTFGEDGALQGILDTLQIPYTHSGRTSCTLAMNKSFSKKIVKNYNILVAEEQVLAAKNLSKQCILNFPVVVKPVNEGSSVGVYIVNNMQELVALETKYNNPEQTVMVEKFIKGREFTVGIMEGKSLAVSEIIVNKGEFYDYASKYDENGSVHILPANITKEQQEIMLNNAETIFKTMNCRGIARVDFRGEGNDIYFLEINTHPGFTSTSLLPEQANYKGVSFLDVCMLLINNATYGE